MKIRVAEHINSLIPYKPGKPVAELQRDLRIDNIIKLASNENPIGPSKLALSAIKSSLNDLNRYPDGGGFYLKKSLSKFHGIEPESIILGNGSNEILELAAKTFLLNGDDALMADQSFLIYKAVVQLSGSNSIAVPLKNYTHDLEGMVNAITEKTRLVFLSNPNNPTGTSFNEYELNLFFKNIPDNVLVIIDEAYIGYEDSINFPRSLNYLYSGKNVLILRTFSKIYGLSGLRIGYGIGNQDIIEQLDKVRQPFNTNSLAQVAAIAALSDIDHLRKSREINSSGKKYLYQELRKLNLNFVSTDTNFILINVGNGSKTYNDLLSRGVIVRPMDAYNFPSHIRVTIGTENENKRFIEELRKCNI